MWPSQRDLCRQLERRYSDRRINGAPPLEVAWDPTRSYVYVVEPIPCMFIGRFPGIAVVRDAHRDVPTPYQGGVWGIDRPMAAAIDWLGQDQAERQAAREAQEAARVEARQAEYLEAAEDVAKTLVTPRVTVPLSGD